MSETKTFQVSSSSLRSGKVSRKRNTRKRISGDEDFMSNEDEASITKQDALPPTILKINTKPVQLQQNIHMQPKVTIQQNVHMQPKVNMQPKVSMQPKVHMQPTAHMQQNMHMQPQTPSYKATDYSTSENTSQTGGQYKNIKVELRKRVITKKVQLNPKKHDAPKLQMLKKDKTRKVRKVILGVKNLHKKMTRAKKLRDTVKQIPIAELRSQLITKGLIKTTSKAPDHILRQIAIDSQLISKKSL